MVGSMIPNNIHFIFFGFTEFINVHYMAIKSALTVHKPNKIFLHYTHPPTNNPYWDEIATLVELVYVEAPEHINGVPLTSFQYKADIVRLETLIQQGGIYLDIDVISIKPFGDLLNNSCVLGIEAIDDSESVDIHQARSITNAVIMCEPNHPFIIEWLNKTAENITDKPWAHHAVCLPLEILKEGTYDVHVEPQRSFMPFDFNDRYIFYNNPANINRLDNSYTVHLWETIWYDELKLIDNNYLDTVDNLFTQLFRHHKREKKMKIAVYAISKNEEQFVKRFCESSKEADIILIADTGSTDNTVKLARKHGAVVHDIHISPWRFDKARDAALALLPRDIDVCISLDLDEELQPGWREEIERVWKEDTTRLRYKFDWGCGIVFFYEKIHHRSGYHWHHPCHEYPRADMRTKEVWAHTDMLLAIHKPDPTKSRGQYLDLLLVAVTEDPRCPRNAFYYARELTFYTQWQEAINALNKYLAMPEAIWENERCYAMRLLARCYDELGQDGIAWHRKACAEAPNTREPWVDLAMSCYRRMAWAECYSSASNALAIKDKTLVYTMDPEVWGAKPHDLLAISAYHLGLFKDAIEHGQIAVDLSPGDARLLANLHFYQAYAEQETLTLPEILVIEPN